MFLRIAPSQACVVLRLGHSGLVGPLWLKVSVHGSEASGEEPFDIIKVAPLRTKLVPYSSHIYVNSIRFLYRDHGKGRLLYLLPGPSESPDVVL